MADIPVRTLDDAPEDARPLLEKAKGRFGFVPNVLGELANAPAALEGYLTLSELLGRTGLSPVEQQVLLLAISFENDCDYCMAAHSGGALRAGVPQEALDALRDGTPIPDARLEALRTFAAKMTANRGHVPDGDVQAFLDAGFGTPQVLEVVLAIGLKTISNYTNHLAHTPLDQQLQGMAWTRPAARAAE
jgi:uncharacterized peroxidase-related enzyme